MIYFKYQCIQVEKNSEIVNNTSINPRIYNHFGQVLQKSRRFLISQVGNIAA